MSLGVSELESGAGPLGRARRPGGGRKRLADADPGLVPALLALVEPEERGDPMSPLRWTVKSTRSLAGELTRQGHKVSADTAGDLLRAEGFSLQGNAKTIEGTRHPDRDGQFRYINEQARAYQAAGDSVISVDAKKKEQVGQFGNAGRTWRPRGGPVAVRSHDFPGDAEGQAIPYGIYGLAANAGWVNVGTDHNTAQFAVESIRRWWNARGRIDYPQARRLLITADAGGSNGYRTRAWKAGLADLARETGLQITCCHFPPGTSKWNKIEHRLFSAITMNWRGRPLTSHEVVVRSIAAATTRTGLTVDAQLDTGSYPGGIKISDQHMAALPLDRHDWHGDWNYTLHPAPPATQATPAPAPPPHSNPRPGLDWLCHPALTGITRQDLTTLTAALDLPFRAAREQQLYAARGGPRRNAWPRRRPLPRQARTHRPHRHHPAAPATIPAPIPHRRPARPRPHHDQRRRPPHQTPARHARHHHRTRTPDHPDPRRLLPLRPNRRNRHPRADQTSVLIICPRIALRMLPTSAPPPGAEPHGAAAEAPANGVAMGTPSPAPGGPRASSRHGSGPRRAAPSRSRPTPSGRASGGRAAGGQAAGGRRAGARRAAPAGPGQPRAGGPRAGGPQAGRRQAGGLRQAGGPQAGGRPQAGGQAGRRQAGGARRAAGRRAGGQAAGGRAGRRPQAGGRRATAPRWEGQAGRTSTTPTVLLPRRTIR